MSLFSVPLEIDCALTPEELLARMRTMVEKKLRPATTAFRWRQFTGWILEERDGTLELRIADSDPNGYYNTRFIGRIERVPNGSRLSGRVAAHWLKSVGVTVLALGCGAFGAGWFVQHPPAPGAMVSANALAGFAICGAAIALFVGFLRFDLRWTSRLIQEGITCAAGQQI